MIDNTSKISLTYRIGGEYLIRKGNYTVAELNNTTGEVKTHSKTIDEPVFSEPKKHVTLPYSFIEMALERPEIPYKKAPLHEWKAYSEWKVWSKNKRLHYRIMQLVTDLQGFDVVWQLI